MAQQKTVKLIFAVRFMPRLFVIFPFKKNLHINKEEND